MSADTMPCGHREAVTGCLGCTARVRANLPTFPLQFDGKSKPGPVSAPWTIAERAWAAYAARHGRDQSVERIAQRGGFSWGEMDLYFPEWREVTDECVVLRLALKEAREAQRRAEVVNAGLRYALETLVRACPDEGAPPNWNSMQWLRALGAAEHAIAVDHPGGALVDLANAVSQYQYRDETTLLETFRRLMDERARIAHMYAPEYVQALEALHAAVSAYLHEMHTAGIADDAAVGDACAPADALKGKS